MVQLASEGPQHLPRTSDANVHEVAVGHGAVLKGDGTDDAVSTRPSLPPDRVLVPINPGRFENRFAEGHDDSGPLDVATVEGRISDKTVVSSEQRDSDDLPFITLFGHGLDALTFSSKGRQQVQKLLESFSHATESPRISRSTLRGSCRTRTRPEARTPRARRSCRTSIGVGESSVNEAKFRHLIDGGPADRPCVLRDIRDVIERHEDGRTFSSLSTAATEAAGIPAYDGWYAWKANGVLMKDLRHKLIEITERDDSG
jgi:hypothetical protein